MPPKSRVISIDSRREAPRPEEHPPQPSQSKRPFYGNKPTERSVLMMHRKWVWKIARFYRMPPERVEEQIIEELHKRRAV